jgi:hypothetical protein
MSIQLLAVAVFADGENKKSGPIGLAVILVLCIACYFLFKSMSKHLRKVREEFPVGEPPVAVPPGTRPPAAVPPAAVPPGEVKSVSVPPPPARADQRGEDEPPRAP